MATRKLLAVAAALTLGAALPAAAVDAPHDGSFTTGSCETCHKLHGATGGTLSSYSSNDAACVNCHLVSEPNIPGNRFAMPWAAGDQAVPRTSGNHHNWSAPAANSTYGTVAPGTPMSSFLVGGNLQCGTCHDPHPSNKTNYVNRHVSLATGTPLGPTAGIGGTTPTMTLTVAAGTASTARGYRVYVTGVSGTQFRMVISNDFGKATPTWSKVTAVTAPSTTWGTATGTGDVTGVLMNMNTLYNLNDGSNVQVTFSGTLVAGLEWKFYVAYPHLRVSNVADANGMCVNCHANRVMDHLCVEGTGGANCTANGTNVFSHPVGQALNANAKGYDNAAPLDVDGTAANGSTTDGDGGVANPTNDLNVIGGKIGCLSCHAPHNGDSNSLSVDSR